MEDTSISYSWKWTNWRRDYCLSVLMNKYLGYSYIERRKLTRKVCQVARQRKFISVKVNFNYSDLIPFFFSILNMFFSWCDGEYVHIFCNKFRHYFSFKRMSVLERNIDGFCRRNIITLIPFLKECLKIDENIACKWTNILDSDGIWYQQSVFSICPEKSPIKNMFFKDVMIGTIKDYYFACIDKRIVFQRL